MKRSIYTILDEKAQTIGPLFLAVSDDEAARTVTVSCATVDIMKRYPADFALLRLGDVEISTGEICPNSVPVLVHKLDELLNS